jgi:hypothetical protein
MVRFSFNTFSQTDEPITLAGTPSLAVYKDGNTTESTAGITLTVDFDSVTGLHRVAIDTSSDGTFYAGGSEFSVLIVAGTVDGNSVVGSEVASFSLGNRAAYARIGAPAGASLAADVATKLAPTVAGRTLDVTPGGAAGIDWNNVESAGAVVNLSMTTINVVGTANGIGAGGILAASFEAGALQTELGTYDGPTKSEMAAAFTEIKGTTWDGTNTLEGIFDGVDGITVTTDPDQEIVGIRNTWILQSDNSATAPAPAKYITDDNPDRYAIDFREMMASSSAVYVTGTPTLSIYSGTAGGVTFSSEGRLGKQAKVLITPVTPGTYVIKCVAEKNLGGSVVGYVTLVVQ